MTPSTPDSEFIPVEGGRLHTDSAGQGTALVLLHAGIADLTMWDDDVPALAINHQVIRYDARGFGRSESRAVPFSNRDDLRRVLDHFAIDRGHILGISRGGHVAVDFCLEFPARVRSLILVASGLGGFTPDPPPADDPETRMFQEMEATYARKEFERLAELEVQAFVDGPRQPPSRVPSPVRERVRRMSLADLTRPDEGVKPQPLDPPAAGRLGEIDAPTLILIGDLDTSGTLATADALARGIRGARKVVLPGVAHMVNLEQPAKFQRIVLDFLADRDGRPGSLQEPAHSP